jgi:4-hydroxy-tetrahydrodipicolinate synthase
MSQIRGIYPIIATPFNDRGEIDETGMRRIIRYVLKAGVHGVAYPAVASEFYALRADERKHLTEVIMDEVNGKVPVVIGISSPSAEIAVDLGKHAVASGADFLLLLPPYVVKDDFQHLLSFYQRVADSVPIPLILQNAPAPMGAALSPEAVFNILKAVPQITYVKEENPPCGHRISALLRNAPANLQGVLGGAGGRYVLDEYQRGAVGSMPACELMEVHVAIYIKYMAGDIRGARNLFQRLLPILNFQAVFRMNMTKEVLKRWGLIESSYVRVGSLNLDEGDLKELDILLNDIDDLLLKDAHNM